MRRVIHSIVQTSARLLVLVFTGAAFLSTLLIALTQFGPARSWALEQGLTALNKKLNGHIEVGSVDGNLISGFSLHDVRVTAGGTTLLETRLVEIRYQFRPILKERSINAEVIIRQPRIMLVRNATDSLWNFEKLFKAAVTQTIDTAHLPFPFIINARGIEIIDADVSMLDMTRAAQPDTSRAVDFARLHLADLNLSAIGHYDEHEKWLAIQHISGQLPRADINIVDIGGTISADSTGARIHDLRIETDRTLLTLNAQLDSVDFFAAQVKGPDAWRKAPVTLQLDAPRVSTLELQRFLPALAFLGGTPAITLDAQGTFGDVRINQLRVGLAASRLSIAGRVRNLHHADSLLIDARITDSRVDYADVPVYLPGLHLPDLRYLGPVDLHRAEFVGSASTFTAAVDLVSRVGTARGGASFDLRNREPHYSADFVLVHANGAAALRDSSLASDFNGRLVARGTGFALSTADITFRLISESSTVVGRSYRKLVAHGSVRDNGLIRLDTMIAVLGPHGAVNGAALLAGAPGDVASFTRENIAGILGTRVTLSASDQALAAAGPSVDFSGMLDMRDRSTPRYDGHLRAQRFALADVIPGGSQARATFVVSAQGSKFDPDQIEATAEFKIIEAELPGHRMVKPFGGTIVLASPAAGQRLLKLESDIADVNLSGVWNFKGLVGDISLGVSSIADYVQRKSGYREEDPFATPAAPFSGTMNATYSLTVKDLTPLEIVLGGARLAATGELHGEISATSQFVSISAAGDLKQATYSRDKMNVSLHSTRIQLDIRNLAPGNIDALGSVNLTVQSDSTARFNDISFTAPRFSASLDNGAFRISGATAVNGAVSMAVGGEINMSDPAGYRVALDTVRVGLPNGIRWRNISTVRALVSDDRVTIDSLVVQRNRSEIVEVSGSLLHGDTFDDLVIHISQGSLGELAALASGADAVEARNPSGSLAEYAPAMSDPLRSARDLGVGGWLRDGRLKITGTLEHPVVDGAIAIDSIRYGGALAGNALVEIKYAERNLGGAISVGPMSMPIGTAEEARADLALLRTRLARRIARINTDIPTGLQIPTITVEDTTIARQQEQITTALGALRKLSGYRIVDSALRVRVDEARRSILGTLTQWRTTLQAETSRATFDSAKLTARVDINTFPIDLAIASREERIIEGGPVDIRARTDSLPIAFLAPLIPGIRVQGGTADMGFLVTGNWPQLVYSGEGALHHATALVEGNNMIYSADGQFKFREQKLSIENLTIHNDPRDLPNGSATITGTINFDGFQLKDLNLYARMQQFMVLSDATQAVSESLYGPLVIATGANPLHFSGTLAHPRLDSGDIDVLRGNLKMDRGSASAASDPNPATYVDLSEWRRRADSDDVYGPDFSADTTQRADTTHAATDRQESAPDPGSLEENFARVQDRIGHVNVTRRATDQSIADVLEIDLKVGIPGRLYFTIDFSPIEQLRAVIGTDRQRFSFQRASDGTMDLRGAVKLLSGSKYEFIKSFDATGDLTFAGPVNKTKLAIVAEHNGRRLRTGNSGLETYRVIINILGTLEKPDITMNYSVDNQPAPSPDQDVLNRNAISLLLFGRTSDELVKSEVASQVGDFSSSVIGSSTSSFASRLLTDLLTGGADFIRSIDLDLSGRAANARLTVVSQFGDAIVRAGGQVTDPLNNGTLVVEVPFSSLTDAAWLRNLAIDLEANRQSTENTVGTTSESSQSLRVGIQFHNVW